VPSLPATPPLLFQLPAADGSTTLLGSLFLPDPARHGRGPYPLCVLVYGGPHVARVKADFTAANEQRAQFLRSQGVLVAALDNRGAARRGRAFEAVLRRSMGGPEVDDQCALVAALVAAGLADAARVGACGWSYGGYMTLMLLAKRADVFCCGVAGAPVTSWDGYDTGVSRHARSAHARLDVITRARARTRARAQLSLNTFAHLPRDPFRRSTRSATWAAPPTSRRPMPPRPC
jgi:dipeptidyl-peptidase-4